VYHFARSRHPNFDRSGWRVAGIEGHRWKQDMTDGMVHVTTGLEVGGAEMLLLELCRMQIQCGRNVSVASLISDGPMRERFTRTGIEVIGLGMKRGQCFASGLVRLVRLIREMRPRLIQGWLYHANLAAIAATWLSGVFPRPRLAWGIFGALPEFACYPPRLRRVVRASMRLSPLVDGIIFNSEVALEAHQRYGFRARLTQLVSNGIDLTTFGPRPDLRAAMRQKLELPEDAVVVIAVGRLDPMKNWPGMLAATASLANQNVWFIAVGRGTEQLPPGPQRRLLGRRDDMPALYAAADIFLLASHFGEGTSVALAEAMACGLPVIVTDVGDNGAVAEDAGLVVKPYDADSLAQALSQLAGDPTLRSYAGKTAQARAAGFGVDRLHAGFCAFYDSLLGRSPERALSANPDSFKGSRQF
jgi:glycosyltransferase involved in cell wall biosynthesis